MSTTPAIIALVATLALGVATGLLYLQRVRRKRLVTAHLIAALTATGLVAVLLAAGRGGSFPGAVPMTMLAVSVAAGWGASRVARRTRRGAELMLAGHAVLGVASFLVFLAWARSP